MLRKILPKSHAKSEDNNHVDDFKVLLHYINDLASHKLGYPVSLLTYLGIINNKSLGIAPGSLANVLLNNVGDPFKDSETSRMEVKKHERKLIAILEKYYGLQKNEARGYVTTGGTEGNFASLWWSKRYLINNALEHLIKIDDAIKLQVRQEQELRVALAKIPMNNYQVRATQLQKIIDIEGKISIDKNTVQQLLTPTVFYTKNHTHYSIPKIAEILRLNIKPIGSNPDGSMDLDNFKKELLLHRGAHPDSAVIVIANIGTTVTGAIDNVPGIKKILDETRPKVTYTIHLDGALTGFVMPILKPFGDIPDYFASLGVNTLAVSAHKYPGLSQPCGIVLARKQFFEKAFEKSERSIDYVGNILDVTITGSRSGLNVLMFYHALCAIGLDKNTDKLKKMVEENLANAKYLYEQLVKIFGSQRVFYPHHFNVIFPKPSIELAKKYQLMLTGDRANICVLTNVTRELIDQFIVELKLDKGVVMGTLQKNQYTIDTLQKQHVREVTELFINSFRNYEPITKRLNVSREDYTPFVEEVVQKAIKDGMSSVAVDENKHVIAFIIAEDMANPFMPHLSHYPKLKPVFALLAKLSKPFVDGKVFSKGKVAHLWVAAVDPKYMGHHMFTELDDATIKMVAKKGFNFAYAEFTNEISEKIIHQFKLIELCNRIKYDDFELENGQKPFAGIKGGAAAYYAAIRPGVKLDSLKNCYTMDTTH